MPKVCIWQLNLSDQMIGLAFNFGQDDWRHTYRMKQAAPHHASCPGKTAIGRTVDRTHFQRLFINCHIYLMDLEIVHE